MLTALEKGQELAHLSPSSLILQVILLNKSLKKNLQKGEGIINSMHIILSLSLCSLHLLMCILQRGRENYFTSGRASWLVRERNRKISCPS